MTGSNVYLYCLTRFPGALPPRGLPGARRPRAVSAGRGLWAIVSDAPVARFGEEGIARGLRDMDWVSNCALAHEAVVEHAGRGCAVVPAKLFTVFLDDASLKAHLARERPGIDRAFERIAGCLEFGLRVTFDPARAVAGVESVAPRAATGTAFLTRKVQVREALRSAAGGARSRVEAFHERLVGLSREARRRPPPEAAARRLLLDANYLVEEPVGGSFRATVEDVARRLDGDGYRIALTGPWPPYSFIAEAA